MLKDINKFYLSSDEDCNALLGTAVVGMSAMVPGLGLELDNSANKRALLYMDRAVCADMRFLPTGLQYRMCLHHILLMG